MIFYKNLKKFKKLKKSNLTFSIFANGAISHVDDSISKPNACKSFYNLSYCDGSLKTGLGFKTFGFPESEENPQETYTMDFSRLGDITDVIFDKWFQTSEEKYYYQMILVNSRHELYTVIFFDEDKIVYLLTNVLVDDPSLCSVYRLGDEDIVLFFTKSGLYEISYSSPYHMVQNVPELVSCAVHYDRFFGITKSDRKLVCTSNLNLDQWDDANVQTFQFVDNRGKFTKLVVFNDYVYLFMENGITKISLYSSSNDSSFTHLYASPSKIYENSICVCGDKILFVTRDGLHSFDGNHVSKIVSNYDNFFMHLSNENCASACLDGKYYLATKHDFDDGCQIGCETGAFVNNVLFSVDINNFEVEILRGVDIRKLTPVDSPFMSKLCACFYNDNKLLLGELTKDGKVFQSGTSKSWTSFFTDLGYQSKRKKLKEISLISTYDISVKIVSDEDEKIYQIAGSEKEQNIPINVCGKLFQFSFITTNNNCEIKKPMIVFDVEI